jgi:Peptidase M50B-like
VGDRGEAGDDDDVSRAGRAGVAAIDRGVVKHLAFLLAIVLAFGLRFATSLEAPRGGLGARVAGLRLQLGAPAHAEPSDGTLVWVGLGMSVPTYAIGVAVHEGSHALAGTLMGAELLSIDLLPGRDSQGHFHFGLTRVRGLTSRAQKTFFYLAPKLSDSLLLGGFTAWVTSDGWPGNRYGQLALTVLATGFWVDFTKDVLSFSRGNDIVKVMNLYGLDDEWKRLPVRLGYAAISVALAFAVVHGYQRTFDDPDPDPAARAFVLPMWRASF